MRKVNKIPEWMKKQFELVDKKIKTWSKMKQKWAGIENPEEIETKTDK
jgi:hypothetical protein